MAAHAELGERRTDGTDQNVLRRTGTDDKTDYGDIGAASDLSTGGKIRKPLVVLGTASNLNAHNGAGTRQTSQPKQAFHGCVGEKLGRLCGVG